MIRPIIYAVLVGLVFIAPVNRVDVGSLQPVQVISIYNNDTQVKIETDTGDFGQGESLQQALTDLRETASGVIYFDTAEYLLVQTGLEYAINEMQGILKHSVRVCNMSGNVDLKDVALYLRARGDLPKLKQWNQGEKLPLITSEK